MPKYYVSSCDLKSIVAADTPKEAVIKAFQRDAANLPGQLSCITVVSEHGHESYRDHDLVFFTENILEWTNLQHLFEDVQ